MNSSLFLSKSFLWSILSKVTHVFNKLGERELGKETNSLSKVVDGPQRNKNKSRICLFCLPRAFYLFALKLENFFRNIGWIKFYILFNYSLSVFRFEKAETSLLYLRILMLVVMIQTKLKLIQKVLDLLLGGKLEICKYLLLV